MPSPIASIARMQANNVCRPLQQYRNALPLNARPRSRDDVCRGDGWLISNELLIGDFDLDPVLAKPLVGSVLAVTKLDPGSAWLHDYLYGSPSGAPGTATRLLEESRNAAIGPGGVLGNVNTAMSAAHAVHAGQIEKAIQAGAREIVSGASKSVRINSYIMLYNGNTSGRGRPRPKIRIMNLPIEVVQPTLGAHFKYNARAQTVTEALKNAEQKQLAPKASGLSRTYIRGGFGNGVLTFGPSAALDLADSIRRDTQGKLRFDARRFAIASARSQSGNLLGFATSTGITAEVAFFSATAAASAPVIIISLGLGLVVQIAWGWLGGADIAESSARQALED